MWLSLWSVGLSVSLSLNIAYMMVILDVIQGLSSPQRELSRFWDGWVTSWSIVMWKGRIMCKLSKAIEAWRFLCKLSELCIFQIYYPIIISSSIICIEPSSLTSASSICLYSLSTNAQNFFMHEKLSTWWILSLGILTYSLESFSNVFPKDLSIYCSSD